MISYASKLLLKLLFYLLATIVKTMLLPWHASKKLCMVKSALVINLPIATITINAICRVNCHGQSRLYYKVFCMANLHGRPGRLTAWLLCIVDLRVKLHGSYA
jgi:hypothetical protein